METDSLSLLYTSFNKFKNGGVVGDSYVMQSRGHVGCVIGGLYEGWE